MSSILLLIIAIIATFGSYYLLSFTLTRTVINYYNKLRTSPEFSNSNTENNVSSVPRIEEPTQNSNKIFIGQVNKKFNFAEKSPLKAFSNAYDRTIYAVEKQNWEDWVDAIEKIYKMLKKDFFGTIKHFVMFLINLSKPIEKDDLESRMNKINQQKQQLEVDKMVDKLKENASQDQVYIDAPKIQQLPAKLASSIPSSTTMIQSQKIILLKPSFNLDNNYDMSTVEEETTVELTEFQKLEQRILQKLKEIGVGNYDLWLDLADLYVKNDLFEKAKEIYTYIAKNGDLKSKQKAVNGLIGLD
jgi:hypothetical protein